MSQEDTSLYEKSVLLAQQGDKKAMSLLCEDAMKSSYFIALKVLKNKEDAEDIVSDTMLTVINKIGELKNPKSFKSWVNRIAINKCNDYIKKKKPILYGSEAEVLVNGEIENYDTEFLPEEYVINEEKREIIMDIIRERTSAIEMMSIIMFYYNGDTISTIAKTMNCAEITVKKRLASARKKIKDGIEEIFGNDTLLIASGPAFSLGNILKVEAAKTVPSATAMSNISNILNADYTANYGKSDLSETFKTTVRGKIILVAMCFVVGACVLAAVLIAAQFGKEDNNYETNSDRSISDYESNENNIESNSSEERSSASDFNLEAFERYNVKDLGFTAPSVHTDEYEECKFLWEYTEDDVKKWFFDKEYVNAEEYYYYSDNTTGNNKFDSRTAHYETAYSSDTKEKAGVLITSEGYNENTVTGVEFRYTNADLNLVVKEAEEFIGYMGFENYAEQIIHSDSVINIPTENDMGEYTILTSYYPSEYDQTYELAISFKYYDYEYTNKVMDITPVTMEVWEDDNKISEWLPNTSFNTTSLDSFFTDVGDYIKNNFYSDVSNMGISEQTYSYEIKPNSNEKVESKAMIYYIYHEQTVTEPLKNFCCQLSYDGDINRLDIYSHIFTDTEKMLGNELTEDEIKSLSSKRLAYLKKFIPDNNFTEKYLLENYREYVFGEDAEHQTYEKDGLEYDISNQFDTFILSIKRKEY